jgi:hypothetical protein
MPVITSLTPISGNPLSSIISGAVSTALQYFGVTSPTSEQQMPSVQVTSMESPSNLYPGGTITIQVLNPKTSKYETLPPVELQLPQSKGTSIEPITFTVEQPDTLSIHEIQNIIDQSKPDDRSAGFFNEEQTTTIKNGLIDILQHKNAPHEGLIKIFRSIINDPDLDIPEGEKLNIMKNVEQQFGDFRFMDQTNPTTNENSASKVARLLKEIYEPSDTAKDLLTKDKINKLIQDLFTTIKDLLPKSAHHRGGERPKYRTNYTDFIPVKNRSKKSNNATTYKVKSRRGKKSYKKRQSRRK